LAACGGQAGDHHKNARAAAGGEKTSIVTILL